MKQITITPSDLPYTLVNYGVDTLVLNVRFADSNGLPLHSELGESAITALNEWQTLAKEQDKPIPHPMRFRGVTFLIHPHGAGKGQWRWLLTSDEMNISISRGRLNGILAQVRLSSRLLWSSENPTTHEQDLFKLLEEVEWFLSRNFADADHERVHLQVSEIHLCADIAGWDVATSYDWQATMLTRARRRVPRGSFSLPEPSDCQKHGCAAAAGSYLWQGPDDEVPIPIYNGHMLETIEFGSHGSTLSCCIYNKTREIKKSGKTWMPIIWGYHGYDGQAVVTRVEFRWKREAIHNLKQEGVFHGIESIADLKNYLPYLWTYSAGHIQGGEDGLPDGWLRYVTPTNDKTVSRWPVNPVWLVVQSAFTTETTSAVNTQTGEVRDDYPVSSPLAELIRERQRQRNEERLAQQIGGCCSTLSAWLTPSDQSSPLTFPQVFAWLRENLPLITSSDKQPSLDDLSLEQRRLLKQRYDATFTTVTREKQVLYGLQSLPHPTDSSTDESEVEHE